MLVWFNCLQISKKNTKTLKKVRVFIFGIVIIKKNVKKDGFKSGKNNYKLHK